MKIRQIALAMVLVCSARGEVVATFKQGGRTDVRVDRFPALAVEAGQPPSAFLEAGGFEVEWKGSIELKERRRLYFSFEGKGGSAALEIDGEEVVSEEGMFGEARSKRLRLNPGSREIVVRYVSSEDGSGNFRLYWEEADMVRQTIPPTAYGEIEPVDEVVSEEMKRHGRMVFAEQKCAKCHAPEEGLGAGSMPEMSEIGPVLAGLGERVSEDWLRKWIANPKAMNPATRMPRMVDPETPEGLQHAADLAAFLIGGTEKHEKEVSQDKELAKAGGVSFHELGCVACHYPAEESGGTDGSGRVPLNNVASKYLPGQLLEFLKRPEAYHPFTAMPNFQLSDEEAGSLVSFLRAESAGKETELGYDFPQGDAVRGAAVAEALQCGSCHPGLPGGVSEAVSLDGIFKVDWTEKGCVSGKDERAALPVPNFQESEREALLAFSTGGRASLEKDNPAEFAERQIHAKRCVACHSMDGDLSYLSSVHGTTAGLAAHVEGLDERVDQSRPQLTFVGEMLYTSYIEAVLAGSLKERARPWLGTRMPAFKAYSKPLAEGLSRLHGFGPSGPEKVEVDPELAEIGESLVGAEGFACTTCHGIGEMEPTAAFEVGAVDFTQVSERLRKGYYHRWMDHPAEVVPGSKMPRYAEGNESQRADILDGDAAKQYEAIWHWLHGQ